MKSTDYPLLPLVLHHVPPGLRQALGQEGIPCVDRSQEPAAGRYVLWDSRGHRCPPIEPGQLLIDVDRFRRDSTSDPFEDLVDEQSLRKSWRVGEFLASEEVARVDKRAVRRRLLGRLAKVIEQSGGIWLRLSPFPFPYRSAFNFRIDYDEYDADDFDALLQAIAGHEDACSHYVCASTYEGHPEALSRLRDFDVGSHGYWHHTYRDSEENLANIRRGIEVLRRNAIEPSGFVAPHGRFNRALLSALQTLGVTHSSEFALAYDELPFWPANGPVLQLPVHPVCLGIVLDAARQQAPHDPQAIARAVRATGDYLREVARLKYRSGEPVFLYCHPTGRLGRYPQVLADVFETIDHFGAVWRTTLSGFAAWWRARAAVRLRVYRDRETFVIQVDSAPRGFRLGAEYCRGEHVAPLPLNDARVVFSPGALAFQRRHAPELPQPVRIDRAHSFRGSVLRYLDWEKVTPVDQLPRGTLRGWMKRTLRRIRS